MLENQSGCRSRLSLLSSDMKRSSVGNCLDSACLMLKAYVVAKLRLTALMLSATSALHSLLLVVNRNLWLLIGASILFDVV